MNVMDLPCLGDPAFGIRAVTVTPSLTLGSCPAHEHRHVTTAEQAIQVIRGGGTAVLPPESWREVEVVVNAVCDDPPRILFFALVRAGHLPLSNSPGQVRLAQILDGWFRDYREGPRGSA